MGESRGDQGIRGRLVVFRPVFGQGSWGRPSGVTSTALQIEGCAGRRQDRGE